MANTDEYKKLKTKAKDSMFTRLFELKAEKKVIEDEIKSIEDRYKPDLDGLRHDLFYQLSNGTKFSIKRSERKGNINTKAIEKDTGIDCDRYRNKPTVIYTLRTDSEG